MKGNLVFNVVFSLAIIVLFALHFSSRKNSPSTQAVETVDSSSQSNVLVSDSALIAEISTKTDSKIAYVNIDTLNKHYKYISVLEKKFEKEYKTKQDAYLKKASKFQEEYQMFMEQAQKGMINQQQAQQIEESLRDTQTRLMQEEQQVAMSLQQKQLDLHNEIMSKISAYLAKYAEDLAFDYVLAYSKESPVLYARKDLDITAAILKGLNNEK